MLGLSEAVATPPEAPIRSLSLVAVDSRNQPVSGLTADDFEVLDGGKPRKVAFVRHIERRLAPSAGLEPDEFSNRTGQAIPHATVILLDLMNQDFSTRGVAEHQLVKYLQTLEGADYVYLYLLTLDGRLYSVRGLPASEERPDDPSNAWTKTIAATMDKALRAVERVRPVDMDVAVRVQLTYGALETLGRATMSVPGRKNVVWITDGVPITLGPVRSDTGDIVDFTPWLKELSAVLERSEIAIYPVPQIMIGSSDAPPDAPGVPRRGVGTGELSLETLNQFANMTGGRPNGGKDIAAAITQAMNDARTSYQIGYYAEDEKPDGKFHKLKIACARKPVCNGVRIQAKTGYYAWPEDPDGMAMDAFRSAVTQPVDASEIGIRGSLTPGSDGNADRLKVRIDARDIALVHGSQEYTGHLSFLIAGYEGSGAAHPSSIRGVDLRYSDAEREKVLKDGIDYSLDLPARENMTTFRFIVLDTVSHSMGSLTLQLKPGSSNGR